MITQTDRDRSIKRATTAKSPFQPALYITNTKNTLLTENLLRIRTQSSAIPAHVSSPPDRPYTTQAHINTGEKDPHIPYNLRFCRHCHTLQREWPQGYAPGPYTIQGTETHILLHCSKYTQTQEQANQREELENDIDFIITCTIEAKNKIQPTPQWHNIPEQEKVSLILGAAPPKHWNLTKKQEDNWTPSIENTISQWIKPIIIDALKWKGSRALSH